MDFLTFVYLYIICFFLACSLVCILLFQNTRFHHKVDELNRLGIEYQNNGQWKEAVAVYKKAIQLNPYRAISHSNLGQVLCQNELLQDALDEFNTAIKIEPLNSGYYKQRGDFYLRKMGNVALAQIDSQRASELCKFKSTVGTSNTINSKSEMYFDHTSPTYSKNVLNR